MAGRKLTEIDLPRRSPGHDSAFHLGPGRRAMVSLGPLKPRNYCTYSCPFCYVQGPFPRYQGGAEVDDVLAWLRARREDFDIVYVSGDTDSFAPPRGAKGLALLAALAELGCDLLFTTRHVFDATEREELARITAGIAAGGRMLVGCVSVAQLRHPALEPPPIAPASARVAQLAWMRSVGLATVLTIRPFIPLIAASEYAEIAEKGTAGADVVLGGDWFVDPAGIIRARTEAALGTRLGPEAERRSLDFSDDSTPWRIYRHPDAEAAVRAACADSGRPFFMRSAPALTHLRDSRA